MLSFISFNSNGECTPVMQLLVISVFCICLGLLFWTLDLKKKLREKEQQNATIAREKLVLEITLKEAEKRWQEKTSDAATLDATMKERFVSLASEVLQNTQRSFFHFAKESFKEKEGAIDSLVKPLKDSLEKVDAKIFELEKSRIAAYTGVSEHLKQLMGSNEKLQRETEKLVTALRQPHVRGRWGEVQLRRVVELAGMIEHCDFGLQEVVASKSGSTLRPDLVIKLPNKRTIVVDAKTPLHSYLEAIDVDDEAEYQRLMVEHTKQLKTHIFSLSEKSYFQQFERTPEFVVLFLPSETIFYSATLQDKMVFEMGVERNVLIATPMTLIALLRAVAHSWTEERITENALQIAALGKTLYERLAVLTEHIQKTQKSIASSQDAMSRLAASFEKRVLVTAKKFDSLGVSLPGVRVALEVGDVCGVRVGGGEVGEVGGESEVAGD